MSYDSKEDNGQTTWLLHSEHWAQPKDKKQYNEGKERELFLKFFMLSSVSPL